MRIGAQYKVREMAGEHVVIMQGRYGADMTRVVALNEASLYLWQELSGRDFDATDAASLLMRRYAIDEATALHDAGGWVKKLRDCNLISDE